MKRFVAASAIVLIIAILAIPSFARGPGWGRGSDRAGSWGRDSGYFVGRLTEDTETLPLSSEKS